MRLLVMFTRDLTAVYALFKNKSIYDTIVVMFLFIHLFVYFP